MNENGKGKLSGGSSGRGVCRRELYLLINFAQGERAVEGGKRQRSVERRRILSQPFVAGLSCIMHDARLVLRDKQIVAESVDCLISCKLFFVVARSRAWRQHFDDQYRVGERVHTLQVLELQLAARHARARVAVRRQRRRSDRCIGSENPARSSARAQREC